MPRVEIIKVGRVSKRGTRGEDGEKSGKLRARWSIDRITTYQVLVIDVVVFPSSSLDAPCLEVGPITPEGSGMLWDGADAGGSIDDAVDMLDELWMPGM